MKNIWTILLILLLPSCNLNLEREKSFLELIKTKVDNSEISEDHFYRLKVFHKYMRDNNRLNELNNKDLLSIQDNYSNYIKQEGELKKHSLVHKDLKIISSKEIKNDSIFYIIKYKNRTEKDIVNMKLSINIYDMQGQFQQTNFWFCEGPNCLDGFKAKVSSSILDRGMKINSEDKMIYEFEIGDEIKMSKFKINGVLVNYTDNSKTEIGRI